MTDPLDPSVFALVLTVTLPDVPLFAVPVENVKARSRPSEIPHSLLRGQAPHYLFSP